MSKWGEKTRLRNKYLWVIKIWILCSEKCKYKQIILLIKIPRQPTISRKNRFKLFHNRHKNKIQILKLENILHHSNNRDNLFKMKMNQLKIDKSKLREDQEIFKKGQAEIHKDNHVTNKEKLTKRNTWNKNCQFNNTKATEHNNQVLVLEHTIQIKYKWFIIQWLLKETWIRLNSLTSLATIKRKEFKISMLLLIHLKLEKEARVLKMLIKSKYLRNNRLFCNSNKNNIILNNKGTEDIQLKINNSNWLTQVISKESNQWDNLDQLLQWVQVKQFKLVLIQELQELDLGKGKKQIIQIFLEIHKKYQTKFHNHKLKLIKLEANLENHLMEVELMALASILKLAAAATQTNLLIFLNRKD